MIIKYYMGMRFDEDRVPNFGSIELTSSEHLEKKEYILNSEDVEKLDLITNAGAGSTALCIDTGDLYIKHKKIWKKIEW